MLFRQRGVGMNTISIVTVCYNSAKTIRRSIESVISQPYDAIEYIIIDGGSTDGTLDIIRDYEDKIAYWCSETDNGIYDAMNKGIKKSTGDIIAFINSDDWYVSDVFKVVADYFEQTQADVLYGDFRKVWTEKRTERFKLDNLCLDDLYYRFLFCHQAMFFKRKLFDSIGLYNTNYKISADYEWVLRAYINNTRYVYLPKEICYFSYGGLSSLSRKLCAEEGRNIKLSLLPKELEEKYIPQIEQYYIAHQNSTFYDLLQGVLYGNSECVNVVKPILNKMSSKIILWGAGKIGRRYASFFSEIGLKIVAIMDNNSYTWGREIEQVKVIKPKYINGEKIKIVIAVKDAINEIRSQLLEMGYEENSIMTYEEVKDFVISNMDEK